MPLEEALPAASPQALDLLGRFLLYPPQQRISASQVGDTHCPDPPCSCPCDLAGWGPPEPVMGWEQHPQRQGSWHLS